MLLPTICVVAVSGCLGSDMVDDKFTQEDWALLQTFRIDQPELRPGCPAGLTAPCDGAVALGRLLFYSKAFAGPIVFNDLVVRDGQPTHPQGGLGAVGDTQKVSCADCHDPTHYFIDTRSTPNAQSLGVNWTKRNAISLVNIGYVDALAAQRPAHFGWDGMYDNNGVAGVLDLPLTSTAAIATDNQKFVDKVATTAELRAAYNAVFEPHLAGVEGANDVGTAFANLSVAVAAYEYRLVSIDSPFDHYLAGCADGDCSALNEQQKRGLQLFIGKALCSECHRGPLLSDGEFHNTGIQQTTGHAFTTDFGRGFVDAQEAGQPKNGHVGVFPDDGTFRTPSLRNAAETGPYMHAGQFSRLDEVINFYNQLWPTDFAGARDPRLAPLGLDDGEIADLESLLHALTGSPPDATGGVP